VNEQQAPNHHSVSCLFVIFALIRTSGRV